MYIHAVPVPTEMALYSGTIFVVHVMTTMRKLAVLLVLVIFVVTTQSQVA
jgi:hypothetical protein